MSRFKTRTPVRQLPMPGAIDHVLHPRYWLLFGLPWPGGSGPAEATVAIAPSIIPRDGLSHDARDVLVVADAYAERAPGKTVFLSDLTLWLDQHASSWPARGTDWEAGQDELLASPTPQMYLQLSQLAHAILCVASCQGLIVHYPDGAEQVTPAQRQELHSAVAQRLMADWSHYVRRLSTQGKIQFA